MISRIRRITILAMAGAIALASAPAIGATITWVGNGDAVSWDDVNNWDLSRAPVNGDDVVIPDVAATTSVTYSDVSLTTQINSLACDEPLNVTGGDLGVDTTADVSQPVTLNGGTCSGGSWKCTGSGAIVGTNNANNYLSGVTLDGDISLSDASARIQIVNGTTFTTAHIYGAGAALQFAPDSVITGDIFMGGMIGGWRIIEMSGGVNGTVTIASSGSIQVEKQTTTFGAAIGNANYQVGHMTLINEGLIHCEYVSANNRIWPQGGFTNASTGVVEAANGGLLCLTTSWTNNGQMYAMGGATLRLQGSTSTSRFGYIDGSGGTVSFYQCAIDNADDSLLLDSSTASWVFAGSTITGGTIDFADGMVMNIAGTNQLNNVSVNGELLMEESGGRAYIQGSTTFETARLNGYDSALRFDPGGVVSGDVWFGGDDSRYRYVELQSNGAAVTIPATSTLQIDSPNNILQVWISGLGSTPLVNEGTIRANVAGPPIKIQVNGGFTNDGLVEAMNGGAVWSLKTANYKDATNTLEGGSWHVGPGSLVRIDNAAIVRNAADIVLDGSGSQFADQNDVDLLAGFAENNANGNFTITNGRNLTTSGPFTNAGVLVASSGSTFTATGNFVQTDGTTTIDAGTLASTTLVDIQGGVLEGNGLVDAPIVNAGSVSPGLSAGTLSGTADFTQTTAGSLDVQIGGQVANDDYDVLAVDGAATLAGTLNVTLINGFEPPVGSSYDILTASSISGTFDPENMPTLVNNHCWHVGYLADKVTLTILSPSVITTQPLSAVVCEGDPVTFSVGADGYPSPTYQWYYDGNPVPGETGSSMAIDEVTTADAGTYTVFVRNDCGEVTSVPVTLGVQTNPVLTVQPASQTVCEGDSVTFSVTVTGDPPPDFQWRKNGANIDLATDASLTIDPVTTDDIGSYDVVVTNACDEVFSDSAMLTVHTAPVITVAPQSQTVCEGDPVTFSVTATGDPTPTYQWKHDGVDITPGGTGTTLTIPSTSTDDEGDYAVVVTNECGNSTSLPATLTIHTAPVITVPPASQTVCEGDPVTFDVTVTGIPAPTYQWMRNGMPIGNANDASLTISSVSIADDGAMYSVEVENECGTATSGAATLTVHTAPVINVAPQSQTVCEGDPVTFSVTATGDPAPTYQWQHEGSDIPNETGTSLTIPSVSPGDAGEYGVVVSNGCGTPTPVATLTVHTAPVITSIGGYPDTVCAGESVTLSVTVSGDPAPTYQWKLDDAIIPGATSDSLTIEHAMTASAGVYTVEVVNACGSAVSDPMPLTVHTMPEITVQPQSQTVCEGDSAIFSVTVTSDSAETYQWYHGGVEIIDAIEASVTIDSVSALDDAGEYYVEVTNACGPVFSSTAVLTVHTLPVVTIDPAGRGACEGGAVTFSVSAAGDPAPSYQWRHGGADIGGATAALLTINPIALMDAGAYDVVVTNTCGSDTSAVAMLTVFETHSGDVNADSRVDGADIQMFVNEIMNPGEPSAVFCAADMDLNGLLDVDDVALFVNALLGE
ncbi:MAG: immunoglobulin domain-containing protein [Phycisphaerales bacterium]|nr:immunoglobulin domain-containing protein [Phycisphaerales bacterium]MCB9858659.1 immunoglobulin domain-containing protein [Phycisphaerales bacterium]